VVLHIAAPFAARAGPLRRAPQPTITHRYGNGGYNAIRGKRIAGDPQPCRAIIAVLPGAIEV